MLLSTEKTMPHFVCDFETPLSAVCC